MYANLQKWRLPAMFDSYKRVIAYFSRYLRVCVRAPKLRGMKKPLLSPEGDIIEAARKKMVPKMSVRRAAEITGISESWWRQIVKGTRPAAVGVDVDVHGPTETVALMAKTVDADSDEFRTIERHDVADRLDYLRQVEGPGVWDGDLTVVPDEDLLSELARRLASRAPADREVEGAERLRLVARRTDANDTSTFEQ